MATGEGVVMVGASGAGAVRGDHGLKAADTARRAFRRGASLRAARGAALEYLKGAGYDPDDVTWYVALYRPTAADLVARVGATKRAAKARKARAKKRPKKKAAKRGKKR